MNRILTYGERAAEFGEVSDICARINDFESWFVEWNGLASRAEREGRYLHAAFYYRMAEFFLADDRDEKFASYQRCKNNFKKAIAGDRYVEFLDIPFMGVSIPRDENFTAGTIKGGYSDPSDNVNGLLPQSIRVRVFRTSKRQDS